MADIYSSAKRSEIMSHIRSKDTVAEKIVFQYLRSQKIYFQKHYKRVVGKPDIALPRKKRAVFINGDFWHGKTYDKVLKNHAADSYWAIKIARNMERDIKQQTLLCTQGWIILNIWEDDIKRLSTRTSTLKIIQKFLLGQ